jgi:hypothetical protein
MLNLSWISQTQRISFILFKAASLYTWGVPTTQVPNQHSSEHAKSSVTNDKNIFGPLITRGNPTAPAAWKRFSAAPALQ